MRAKSRPRVATGNAVGVAVINADREPDDANPHTWLPLLGDPPGSTGLRILYGVLRPNYRGHTNTACAFGRAKLQVVPPVSGDPWEVTAARAEVLLPVGADDRYLCPRELIEAVDAHEREPKPALLAYATLTWPTGRLHEQYEPVRQVFAGLVRLHGCPVLLVQHAPHLARSSNQHHCHALIVPRRLSSLGFGAFVGTFTGDKGRQFIVDAITARLAEDAA